MKIHVKCEKMHNTNDENGEQKLSQINLFVSSVKGLLKAFIVLRVIAEANGRV